MAQAPPHPDLPAHTAVRLTQPKESTIYEPGTILTKKDPYEAPAKVERNRADSPDATPTVTPVRDLTPLNVIRVIAPSPVREPSLGEWVGGTGDALIVTPHEQFGANEVIPQSALQALYEVTSVPEDEPVVERKAVLPSRQISPEEAFASGKQDGIKKGSA